MSFVKTNVPRLKAAFELPFLELVTFVAFLYDQRLGILNLRTQTKPRRGIPEHSVLEYPLLRGTVPVTISELNRLLRRRLRAMVFLPQLVFLR